MYECITPRLNHRVGMAMSRTWKDRPDYLGGRPRHLRAVQSTKGIPPIGDRVIALPKRARLLLVVTSKQEVASWLPGGELA